MDFDAYSIADKNTLAVKGKLDMNRPLNENEKVWRISSLTAQVDEDTKILLLPLPESKRKTRIQDT